MKKRLKLVILTLSITLSSLIGYFTVYKSSHQGLGCLIYRYTKYKCPTCGVTRMLSNIISLNIKGAFLCNPGIFITSPLLLFFGIRQIFSYVKNSKCIFTKLDYILLSIIALILLAYTILRNTTQIF